MQQTHSTLRKRDLDLIRAEPLDNRLVQLNLCVNKVGNGYPWLNRNRDGRIPQQRDPYDRWWFLEDARVSANDIAHERKRRVQVRAIGHPDFDVELTHGPKVVQDLSDNLPIGDHDP